MAMNAPFAASDLNIAPLSDVDDGFNDLVILRGVNGGRVRMARLLLSIDNGDYWTETGNIRRNLPIEYVKAKTWELRPRVKGNQTLNHSVLVEDSIVSSHSLRSPGVRLEPDDKFDQDTTVQNEYNDNAFFSVDGERYPS